MISLDTINLLEKKMWKLFTQQKISEYPWSWRLHVSLLNVTVSKEGAVFAI